jgi:hypothetical protein
MDDSFAIQSLCLYCRRPSAWRAAASGSSYSNPHTFGHCFTDSNGQPNTFGNGHLEANGYAHTKTNSDTNAQQAQILQHSSSCHQP